MFVALYGGNIPVCLGYFESVFWILIKILYLVWVISEFLMIPEVPKTSVWFQTHFNIIIGQF